MTPRPEWGTPPPSYAGGGIRLVEVAPPSPDVPHAARGAADADADANGDADDGGGGGGDGGTKAAAPAPKRQPLPWPREEGAGAGTVPQLRYFCFEPSPGYVQAQQQFGLAQATHDPNAVVQLLAAYPYHADALLALGELQRCLHFARRRPTGGDTRHG